jgi:S1-C subfamily serine protease
MKIARTFLPFDNRGDMGDQAYLSPPTDRSVMPFNNVHTIGDIIFDGRKYKLPGAGGDWGVGDEASSPSYKPEGSDYKASDQYLEELRRQRDFNIQKNLLSGHYEKPEEWVVVMEGGTRTFSSFPLAQQYNEKMKSKHGTKAFVTRTAQVSKIQTIADALDKTFLVDSVDLQKGSKETGSAFCVGKNLFLTCAHVVAPYDKNNIANTRGFGLSRTLRLSQEGRTYDAELVDYDLQWDIALLKAKVDVEPFKISKGSFVGDDILAIGSPHGFENNVTEGIISSQDKEVYFYGGAPTYTFVDANILPGNSGGPIIKERDGSVVGLVTLIVSQEGLYGLNAALPANYIENFLKKNNISV